MLVYPQLATGASVQYPATRRRACRTVVNLGEGGTSIKYADDGAEVVEWELTYTGLTDDEAVTLEDFFRSTEGRLKSFVFPDPLGNLLAWSDKLDEGAWSVDPQIALAGGQADPFGAERACRVTNLSGGEQGIRQTLELPPDRTYCFSVFAKAAAACAIEMTRDAERRGRAVGTEWTRLVIAGQSSGSGESVTFGMVFPAGASVLVFGAQVEGQIGASGYKGTGSRGGVYENARFRDDELRITAEGVGRHSCRVHITHANHL
jgi:hypothetical protein